MNPLSEIRKSIKGMASGSGGLFTAKVLSADGEKCCVDIDGLVVSDVQLRAVVNGEESGILITPKTGSYVTVADLSGDLTRIVVVGFSEVESIKINGGQLGGLVKIEKLVDRLNYIENKIGALMDIFNDWGPVAQDGGAALRTALFPWYTGQIKKTRRADIEDEKVKH
ncbi:MAG: hypothetical protein IKQ20_09280 [Bacteroidales bacterium]|nr:hypothetical protein [Bacteroidales bacterium]